MRVQTLIPFFGLPSQDRNFDQFLTQNGISVRPVFNEKTENPIERISLQELGLSLGFERPNAYAKQYGSVRENGEMIFSSVFIYAVPEDGFATYSGEILSTLATDITRQDTEHRFGTASRIRDEGDRFGRPNNIEFTWNNISGLSIFIRFLKVPAAVRHVVISPTRI
jgi:hypothetical protein